MAKGKGKVKREATPILPVSHQDAAAGSSTGQPSAKRPRKSNDSTKAGSSLSASDTLTRKGDGQQTLSRAQARQQNRQAAARERRRQQQGVTAERLEAQHANPQYIHNNLSKSYLKILQRVKDDFTSWVEHMISEGQTILFSTSWKTKDDVFVAKGSHPDFACIAAYLQDYVETSDGVLGTTMSLARMETIVTELSVCFYRGTHRKLSPSLLASVRAHVRGKMTTGNGKNNLTTLTREKNFIEAPDLADLAKAYLDERHTSLNLRARIQDLFLLSALTDNTLRIGSLVPKDCEDDRHLTWKNLRLVITKNPNAGQDNLLSIELFTLGGKTRESQHLQAIFDHADHFWSDTCLLLLILAHYDDALPTGWDMQRLLDPLVFGSLTGSDTLTLDFDAQSDDKFVLVSDFNYPKHLEYKAALHALQRAGDLCGFDCVMRFHVLRRTGVILLRLRGKTAQEIQQQLRHKWATSTYLVYVQRMLPGVDAGSSTFKDTQTGDADMIVHLHPDKVRRTKARNYALTAEDRRNILDSETYQQVVSDYRELVEKLLKEAGVDRWKDLPDESRVKTNRAWGAVQREYIKQRKHKIAVLVWESRTGQNVDHQPGEDEFADAYPTEEEAQGEIEAADSFLYNTDFASAAAGIETARREGVIDEDQYYHALPDLPDAEAARISMAAETPIEEEETDIPIDPVLLAEDDLASSTKAAAAPTTRAPTPIVPITSSLKPSTSNAAADGTEAADDTDDDASPIDLTPLHTLRKLFWMPKTRLKVREVVKYTISLPQHRSLVFGHRPGQVPLNDICGACQRPLCKHDDWKSDSDLTAALTTKVKPGTQNVLRKFNNVAVVNSCFETTLFKAHIDELLERYPYKIINDPILGPGQNRPYQGDGKTVFLLRRIVRSKFAKSKDDVKCHTCGVILLSVNTASEHYVEHGIWAPNVPRLPDTKAIEAVEWSAATAAFPEIRYYYHDRSYHWDPLEMYRFSQQVVRERVRDITPQQPYGIDPSIGVPDHLLENERTGNPHCTRYNVILMRGLVRQEGLCLFCTHDPSTPPLQAGRVYHGTVDHPAHQSGCAKMAFRELTDMKAAYDMLANEPDPVNEDEDNAADSDASLSPLPSDADDAADDKATRAAAKAKQKAERLLSDGHYMFDDGRFICPDKVCKHFDIGYGTMYELLIHFCAIHGFHRMGNWSRRLGVQPVDQFVGTEAEFAPWVKSRAKPGR